MDQIETMDAILALKDDLKAVDQETTSSCGYRLVPWLTWDEWNFIRDSLFSSSPDSIARALDRISAWRSRGSLHGVIEVTASIIEIQQKDPYFRKDLQNESSDSEEILAMLYSMAIIRLVNCVVEKNRKKEETSISQAADAINLPRMLIDLRHEGSHRELPSLQLLRRGCIEAVDWLKSYYWDPQKEVIPFQRGGLDYIRKEIKSKLCELAFYIKFKPSLRSCSSIIKGKRSRPCDLLGGRSKFFSLAASKHHLSKTGGYKKHIKKTLNSIVQLYSTFSSEVVSLLLEFLLNASYPEDDWKVVITRISSKEPELVLSLLDAVLDMIQSREAMKDGTGRDFLFTENQTEMCEIERLSSLFRWLVGNLMGLKCRYSNHSASKTDNSSAEIDVPKSILTQLLRKCLLVSAPGNSHLMDSALLLAAQIGNNSMTEKLKKFSLLYSSNSDDNEEVEGEDSSSLSCQNRFVQLEESLSQAAINQKFLKFKRLDDKIAETTDDDLGNSDRWLVDPWNFAPIGMLTRDVGTSGRLPELECNETAHNKESDACPPKEHEELSQVSGKRLASCDVQSIDNSSAKKMCETANDDSVHNKEDVLSMKGIGGRLMIDGVWKEVEEKELFDIQSAVRILVQ